MKLATQINRHLADGGIIDLNAYGRHRRYDSRHAGWFRMVGGRLCVRRGGGLRVPVDRRPAAGRRAVRQD